MLKIKDPIHNQIIIEDDFLKYFDSFIFQRLKNISQTSFSNFVYPSATHKRFSHSLGVFHLTKKFINNGLNKLSEKQKKQLLLVSLLHDVGHGPFSHIFENIFNFNHEEISKEIIKKYFKKNEITKIFEKQNSLNLFLTSTIDCDKIDYINRDSYFSGVYGFLDTDFILSNCYIKNNKFIIRESALNSIEDLIFKRVNLYKIIYLHKDNLVKDFIFENIFRRVFYLFKKEKYVYLEEDLKSFFLNKYTLENFLNLDDTQILYHINKWRKSSDKILSEFSNMFISKDFFRVINLKTNKIDISKIKRQVEKKYDINYYFKHFKKEIKIIEDDLFIENRKKKIKRAEDISDLIKFFKTKKQFVEFLILPKSISV